jgi:hypothetical protein
MIDSDEFIEHVRVCLVKMGYLAVGAEQVASVVGTREVHIQRPIASILGQ